MADLPTDILPLQLALELAGSLTVAGHPRNQAAIHATAMQFIRLCKVCSLKGRSWTPEQQAEELVRVILTEWEGGWPERGGSKRLQDLHRLMFTPAVLPSNYVRPLGEKPPVNCSRCNDFGVAYESGQAFYCDCPEGQDCSAQFGGAWLEIVRRVSPKRHDKQMFQPGPRCGDGVSVENSEDLRPLQKGSRILASRR
jgi:hypothetical protein